MPDFNPPGAQAGTNGVQDQARLLQDILAEVELTAPMTGVARIDDRVMAAMAQVPRHRFVPPELGGLAQCNGPLPIGHGQTISQPFIVALMTKLLSLRPDHRVLEVGTGCGYQTAILAALSAWVYSLEIIPALAEESRLRLAGLGVANVSLMVADGYRGWPEHAPYDGILVTAAALHIPPPLVDQLKPGGRLVIPVGQPGWTQKLKVLEKTGTGEVRSRDVLDVAFVPLTGGHGAG